MNVKRRLVSLAAVYAVSILLGGGAAANTNGNNTAGVQPTAGRLGHDGVGIVRRGRGDGGRTDLTVHGHIVALPHRRDATSL